MVAAVTWLAPLVLGTSAASPSMGFWPEYEGGRRVELLDGQWDYGLHMRPRTSDSCSLVEGRILGTKFIQQATVASLQECCSLCREEPKCVAFTFEAGSSECFLKDNAKPGAARDGATSGTVGGRRHLDWVPTSGTVGGQDHRRRRRGGRIDSMDPNFVPSLDWVPNTTSVPMTMDAVPPGYMGPRGVALYRRTFVQQPGPARLQFNACGFYCRAFVDGVEIGDHRAGGYVGFFLDIPSVEQETTRELFVLADNRFNATTAPMHSGGDFWHYGGLMRSVLLHTMPKKGAPWPWRAYVLPTKDGYRAGHVNVSVTLTDPEYTGEIDLTLRFDDGSESKVQGQAEKGTVQFPAVQIPSPRLWSTTEPHLHTLTVLGAGGEGITERFGLRWWDTDADSGRLTLNGQILKMHGWNHHTQWPDTGASPTEKQLDDDLRQMLAAGTNYIRGAHYPQDPRWLDRLDESGVVMWEETLGPGAKERNLKDWDFFMKYQLQQLDEMLDMSLNHASIMTWAWFNEGPSNRKAACPAYKACSDRAHQRDPTRFRTWADNKMNKSRCLEHASLISFNAYPGWYQDLNDLSAPARLWNDMASQMHAKYPTKPFTISETGAGGIFEWTDNETDVQWTQTYQAEIIERDVQTALGNSNISGLTLWHYFDFKGNDKATKDFGHCDYLPHVSPPTCGYIDVSKRRPGGENHKGVVDFWRREKKAYAVVAALYNASLAEAAASSGQVLV